MKPSHFSWSALLTGFPLITNTNFYFFKRNLLYIMNFKSYLKTFAVVTLAPRKVDAEKIIYSVFILLYFFCSFMRRSKF